MNQTGRRLWDRQPARDRCYALALRERRGFVCWGSTEKQRIASRWTESKGLATGSGVVVVLRWKRLDPLLLLLGETP